MQVENAIKQSKCKDQLNELLSLKSSLNELIELTSENSTSSQTQNRDVLDDEYALFKV